MHLSELFIIAVGVSMDAFAVSICKGLSVRTLQPKHSAATALWFGGFQALMPLIGYFLGISFADFVANVADVVDSRIAAQLQFQDPAACTQKYADYLRNVKKCDLVICLTHLGFEGEPYTDVELAAKTRGVDIIVGGHSHTKLKDKVLVKTLDGEDVVIFQDGKWGLKVGRLDVDM